MCNNNTTLNCSANNSINNSTSNSTNKINNDSSLVILPFTFSDLEQIAHRLSSDFDNFWNYDTLKDELNSEFSKYIVAKTQDNNIVGFCGIKIILDEAELMNIVVKKDFRGRKISSYMLSEIIRYCKNHEIKAINLEVNIKNTIAINLYKKYNFKEVGLRKKYYNGIDDAILMTLEL